MQLYNMGTLKVSPSAASSWAEWEVAMPWITQSPMWWLKLVIVFSRDSRSDINNNETISIAWFTKYDFQQNFNKTALYENWLQKNKSMQKTNHMNIS